MHLLLAGGIVVSCSCLSTCSLMLKTLPHQTLIICQAILHHYNYTLHILTLLFLSLSVFNFYRYLQIWYEPRVFNMNYVIARMQEGRILGTFIITVHILKMIDWKSSSTKSCISMLMNQIITSLIVIQICIVRSNGICLFTETILSVERIHLSCWNPEE